MKRVHPWIFVIFCKLLCFKLFSRENTSAFCEIFNLTEKFNFEKLMFFREFAWVYSENQNKHCDLTEKMLVNYFSSF